MPEPEPDRLSKLEYVAAMAGLQQRTRAYDLADREYLYRFSTPRSGLLGLDGLTAKSGELTTAINRADQDWTCLKNGDGLFKCEEIVRGEPTNKKEVVVLIASLRDLEIKLGIKRSVKTKI